MKKPISNTTLLIIFLFLVTYLTDTQAQVQNDTSLIATHYVFPDFVLGSVKMKDGLTESAIMNYNMLTQEMIFEKDGVMLALDSLVAIDTVYIESRIFVPHENVFYEVLVRGPVSLFVQHKCNILAAGNPSGYGGTSETGASRSLSSLTNSGRAYKLTLPSEFHVTDGTKFWIRRDNTFYKANNSAQIINIFPEKGIEIKQFIKQNKLDLKNTNDLVALVVKCNEFTR